MTRVSGRIRHFPSASGGVHVPAFLVVALFLLAGHAWAQITCPYTLPDTPGDEDLLKKFYCETGGPNNWRNKTGWGNTDLTAWDGVTVQQGRITQLRLQSNNLIGSIPSELGSLTSLEQLILNNNELSGEIPSELGMLTSLQWLHLHSNSLTGSIPSELGSMTGLEQLYLHNNELSGEIPDLSGLTSLQRLNLQSNSLTGSIPSEFGSMTGLERLVLSNNQLSGEIPDLSGMTSLQNLHLDRNQLSGEIPSEFGMMTGLERLFLFGNELSGEIPDLSGMTSLQLLALDQNRLSGEIPSEFGTMTSLQLLYLHENQLSGEIPDLSGMTSLQQLILQSNNLIGSIPSWLGTLTSLQQLILNENQLSGEIPDLSGMTSLQQLYLSNNQLSGEIPSELGTMTSLQRLYLSNNKLSGEIPDLSGMTSLRELILNDNCALTGELPPGLMNLSGLATLNLERTGVSVPADQAFRAWLAGISFTSSSCPPPPPSPPPPSPPPPPPPPESDCEALTEDRGEDGLAISPGCVGTSLVVISREEGKYITVELSVEGDQEHDEVPSIILSFSLLERIEAVSFALSIPSQEELPEGLSIDIMGSHDYGLIRLEGFTAEVGIGDVALGEGGTVTVCLPAPAFEEEEGSMPKLYRYEKGWNPLSGSRMDAVNDIESVCADTSSLPSLLGVFVEIPEPPEEEGDGVCCCSVVSEGDGESVAFNLLLIIISLLAFSLRRRKACVRGFM